MATEEMDVNERFKYLRMMQERYQQADRKTKGRLLDEMEAITGLHRKYLSHRMQERQLYRQPRTHPRSVIYGPDVQQIIAVVAETLDWICAERLLPTLAETAQHLERFGELSLSPKVLTQLQQISLSTLRRILQPLQPPRLPQAHRGRRAENSAQAQVPIRIIPWQEPEPGHFEVDLVHHQRAGQDGEFVCTLQCIDVLTGWSERIALSGYSFEAMWKALHTFHQHCPIPVREIHSDNGSEFVNHTLIAYFGQELCHTLFSRGRPGYHNDNRFVEQKNSSLVRAYLGDLYLHTPQHRHLLNELYEQMWLYYNCFQPVLRQLARRVVVRADGICRVIRQQDEAKTPLQRLLAAKPPVSSATAQRLQQLHDQTNPRQLRAQIRQQLDELSHLSLEDERRLASLR